jgi:CheY-like chemotaxis protein/HPt (histidine-containing phosphotransfer) domain-containing protein
VDLAILDMQMPGLNGVMLAEEIQKLRLARPFPMILLTSLGNLREKPPKEATLFAARLAKPIKPGQLFDVLVQIRHGTRPEPAKVVPARAFDASLAERFPVSILLVDDNAINQKVGVRMLEQMGFKPDVAGNGRLAIQSVEKQVYDILFMDIQMPEMDGLTATEQITSRWPKDKRPVIIAMTANSMQGDREKCLSAGMDDYLPKPLRPEAIQRAIQQWGPVALSRRGGAPRAEPATPPDAPSTATPAVTAIAPAAPVPASNGNEAAVDMERLMYFTDGNANNLRELVDFYLKQADQQIMELDRAIQAQSVDEVRRLAHSCVGASATCGMTAVVGPLRELETQARNGRLADAPRLSAEVHRGLDQIHRFFARHFQPDHQIEPKSSS